MSQQSGDHGVPTRDRLEWLAAVQRTMEAGTLTSSAFALAYVIAFIYLNGKTGVAWPSQQTLAERLHLGERQVRGLLKALEDERFIKRTSLGARRHDEIRLRFEKVESATSAATKSKYGTWLGINDRK